MPPVVRVAITHVPATGDTQVQFDSGGQAFVVNLLLDVVAQMAQKMVPKNEGATPTELRAIAVFLCNVTNRFLAENMKPSAAEIKRIHVLGDGT